MHRFLPALVRRNGGRIVTTPVGHRPRGRGLSKYGFHNRFWPGLVDLTGVLWLKRRTRIPEIDGTD
jgi:dolichol-phosphate mannosyltransferase